MKSRLILAICLITGIFWKGCVADSKPPPSPVTEIPVEPTEEVMIETPCSSSLDEAVERWSKGQSFNSPEKSCI